MKFTSLVSLFFAAHTVSAGQFITGACQQDSDCNPFAGQAGCCEKTQKKCRAVLSLTPGVQACGDGRTPNFDHGAQVVNIGGGNAAPANTNTNTGANKASTGAGSGSGTQFITGACVADNDCAPFAGQQGCCEKTQKKCRAVLSLTPGVQACGDGRTPNFDHGAQVVNIGGGKAAAPAANTGNGNSGNGQVGKGSGKPLGTQFITGPCAADNECASTCCEKSSFKCRAPLSLKSNAEFCGDGRTTKF
ncbi:hypothetical protein HDV01_007159 [Terramyces sp. JEL0728]|nr:hypothetical protein HDV01_007159 [Terramyces sp. JEL0728]